VTRPEAIDAPSRMHAREACIEPPRKWASQISREIRKCSALRYITALCAMRCVKRPWRGWGHDGRQEGGATFVPALQTPIIRPDTRRTQS